MRRNGVEILASHPDIGNDVWNWFTTNYPSAMEIIPVRRRGQFLLGVYHAAIDESLSLDV